MSSEPVYIPPLSSTPFADRKFLLPRHFVFTEMVLFSLISTLMIFAWLPAILSLFTYNTVLPSAMRAVLFLNGTAVCLILLVLFIKREIRSVEYIINDEVIVRKGLTNIKQVRIAEIQSVTLLKFPVTGGVIVIESARGSLTVPLILENIREFVTVLEQVCRSAKEGFRFSSVQFDDLMRAVTFAELKQQRTSAVFRPLLTLCISLLPVNVFVGAVFWDMSIVPLMLWAIAGPLYPIAFYSVTSGFISLKERQLSVEASSLRVANVYGVSGILIGSVYLISGIVFKAFIP